MTETHLFQAEINQLLSLIINTFYSNKEVFLRELVSNASDAIDKRRYNLLQSNSTLPKFSIALDTNKNDATITITDNGIGMNKDDLIKNLGTIAHSGTRSFIESLANGTTDVSLIGQFGVGFYSAYLVADKVTVVSHADGSDPWKWESDASGTYTMSQVEDNVPVGTKIILHLKEDQREYLEDWKIKEIINKHSQYIDHPITLRTEREVEREVEETVVEKKDDDVDKNDVDVEGTVEETKPEETKEKKTVKEIESVIERLNKQAPIWQRKPADIIPEEYNSFYKSFTGDWEDPLAYKHVSIEGNVEFKALLYIPARAPFDMFNSGVNRKLSNIKLFVKRVLITDVSNDIIPEYLSFIKGVVDSNDLPLNVSREMLQQNSTMTIIRKNLIKKGLELIGEVMADKEKADKFYQSFNKNLKLGYIEDTKMRDKIIEYLRFYTSKSVNELSSLDEYLRRMKEGQRNIYFVTGDSIAGVQNLACLEKVKKLGYEVLFMTDPLDEYLVQQLFEYKDLKFVNCSKDGLELSEAVNNEEWNKVCNKVKEILGDKVKEVKVSTRLVERPCVLVSDKYGWTANMERIMKAQALRTSDPYQASVMTSSKILEINPENTIIKELKTRIDKNADDINIKKILNVLYETVMIDSGYSLDDPSKYSSQIYKLLELGIKGESDDVDDVNANGVDNASDSSEVLDLQSIKEAISQKEDKEAVSTMEEVD